VATGKKRKRAWEFSYGKPIGDGSMQAENRKTTGSGQNLQTGTISACPAFAGWKDSCIRRTAWRAFKSIE